MNEPWLNVSKKWLACAHVVCHVVQDRLAPRYSPSRDFSGSREPADDGIL